jgi:serine/threonine protein kinase
VRPHDALPIIQQVIDGIEAAHDKNIIHRDLKLANIKIPPEGVVKILDFGLAKAMDSPPSSEGKPENSPTLTMGATAVGAILGTAAYMAPAQAKGKAADKRSDIWWFGVVLYEVLTCNKLFSGESAVEILGGVLNKHPDISAAPPRVHKLLRWCLEKDNRGWLRSAEGTDAAPLLAPTSQARFAKLPWVAAAVLAIVGASLGVVAYRATRPAEKPLIRISADLGSRAAPAASSNWRRDCWIRPLQRCSPGPTMRPIPSSRPTASGSASSPKASPRKSRCWAARRLLCYPALAFGAIHDQN